MTDASETQKIQALVQKFDPQAKLCRVWSLEGGVSAQVIAFEIERGDGQTKKLLLRRHGPVDLGQNPNIAADEFKLLQILQPHNLAAPRPYYLDQSNQIFPTPYLVIDYIEGQTEFAPADLNTLLHQMAEQLVQIHQIDGARADLAFLPKQVKGFGRRPAVLDHSLNEGRIRDQLEVLWPLPQRNRSVLLHGDFWPGNILWRAGQLAAVIDWEDARRGDPLSDLGNTRLEILWAFGLEAMQIFTQTYQAMMTGLDFTDWPYWDLCAALRPASKLSGWGLDPAVEKAMREKHKLFINQAL